LFVAVFCAYASNDSAHDSVNDELKPIETLNSEENHGKGVVKFS